MLAWNDLLIFTIKSALTKNNLRKLKSSFLTQLTHLFQILFF